MTRVVGPGYELDDAVGRIDVAAVHRYISEESYWAQARSVEVMEELVHGAARVVGLYAPSGEQVGFARVVSDGRTVAYLADVYVLPEHRRAGLGRRMVRVMVEEGPGRDFRWLLHTADAHGLYTSFGFAPPDGTLMERPHVTARAAQGR